MAHVKAGGTTKGNRDSRSKRLGVKIYGGSEAIIGNIIVRQRGTKIHPGPGTKLGKDFTIYCVRNGKVVFDEKMGKKVVSVFEASKS
jgi:large subunit ribosomal protein L27